MFGLYLFGVATCFLLSVSFHTLMSHSARGFSFGLQLDFQGIILLMWSATAPMVYYTFYHEPVLQKVYWSLVSRRQMGSRMPSTYPADYEIDLLLCCRGEHYYVYSSFP